MGHNVTPWIKPKYLPTLPNGEHIVIRQPRDMKQEHVDAWLDHLWDRQEHIIETGSREWVFRFTIGKDTKGIPFASHYNPDFMLSYAESQNVYLGSSTIVPLPGRRNRGGSADAEEEPEDTPPPPAIQPEREIQYDVEDDTLPSNVYEEDLDTGDLGSAAGDVEGIDKAGIEEFGAGDDDNVDMDPGLPPRARTPIELTVTLPPIDLTRSSPSPPPSRELLPLQPAPLADFMSMFEDPPSPSADVQMDTAFDDPTDKAPRWALHSLDHRYRYLKELSTNEWYRDIVEWYRESQASNTSRDTTIIL